jgi:hypothetical protein
MLENKRILFIAPGYFNYSALIRSSLISFGAEVDLFNNQPAGFAYKLSSVTSQNLLKRFEARYFRKLQKRIKGSYNYVLIIRADVLPEEFLDYLKSTNHGTVFIQYIWDDIRFFPALLDTFRYFDRILSYDSHDCKKYGLVFRPFFFIPDDESEKNSKEFDLFFIGIFHTDRLKVLERVRQLNPGIGLYPHLYISPVTFFKAGIPFKKLKLFSFKKMSHQDMISLVRRSTAILDIPKPSQQGLTTRIFEALGAGSKVITTNGNVSEYEFYNESNFMILDRENPKIAIDWLHIPFEGYDVKALAKFQILSWIIDVFDIQIKERC